MLCRLSILIFILTIIFIFSLFGQDRSVKQDVQFYNVVTGTNVSISEYSSNSALVIMFTSLRCPYSKLYKNRIKMMSQNYARRNVQFILVNSNLVNDSKAESIDQMKADAITIKNILYLADKDLSVKNTLKVEKNTEAVILLSTSKGYLQVYQGAIDDNPNREASLGKLH